MEFYLIISIITSILFYISSNVADKSPILSRVLFLLFILLPTTIGGLRNWNLGTDMLGYGTIYFYDACSNKNLLKHLGSYESTEYGYHLLNWLCARTTVAINFFLFVAELIKIILVGLTAWKFRNQINTFIFIFAYMLFFWWYGFSLMRQSIALCFCLYSLVCLYDKKYIPFIILVILGYLFHNSAIFILIIPVIIFFSTFKRRLPIVIFSSIGIFVFASLLFSIAADSGLFAESKRELYLDSGVTSAKTNILIMAAFLLFTFVAKIRNKDLRFFIRACSMYGLMFLSLSSLFEVAFRVSFYPMLALLIAVPMAIQSLNKTMRNISTIAFVSLFILHIVIAAIHGMADTIPYKSTILFNLL